MLASLTREVFQVSNLNPTLDLGFFGFFFYFGFFFTPYISGSSGLLQKRKNFYTKTHIWPIDWSRSRLDLGWTLETLPWLMLAV